MLGLAMLHGTGFVAALAETSVDVMTDPDVAWVILVCGLMGGVIGLLLRTAATRAFTNRIAAGVGSARGALMASWVLGISMFVDDYLNSLAVGAAMRDITDRFQVARERLAYVVDSTAAPISVIIPYSTWGAFFGGLLVANGLAPEGEGLKVYISAIPYMFYAWAAVLIVPLVVWGVIPSLGAMRSADRRARRPGSLVPPEAAHIEAANQSIRAQGGAGYRACGFFVVPMLALVATTVAADNDFLVGLYITLGGMLTYMVCCVACSASRDLRHGDRRLQDHARPLAVLVAAFILKEVNDDLGLATFVVGSLSRCSAPRPCRGIFVIMGLVSFLTGSNWGVFVIVLPIVAALGQGLVPT
jgi:Na+/H+ antiporter NhaC